ncbi:hypothetical protein ACFLR1_04550, partial [Bacteroidota bacterium]
MRLKIYLLVSIALTLFSSQQIFAQTCATDQNANFVAALPAPSCTYRTVTVQPEEQYTLAVISGQGYDFTFGENYGSSEFAAVLSAFDASGSVFKWEWYDLGTSVNPRFSWVSDFTGTLNLNIDSVGCSATATGTAVLAYRKTDRIVSMTLNPVCPGVAVTFTANSTHSNATGSPSGWGQWYWKWASYKDTTRNGYNAFGNSNLSMTWTGDNWGLYQEPNPNYLSILAHNADAGGGCGPTPHQTAYNVNNIALTLGYKDRRTGRWGNNEWNVTAYRENSYTPSFTFGAYIEPNLSYNTTTRWGAGLSPASDNATGANKYQGCPITHTNINDNFSTVSRRVGFPAGYYVLNLVWHDDNIQILKNGVELVRHDAVHGSAENNVWAGCLGATDSVEIRHIEGGGGAGYGFTLVPTALAAGTLTSNAPTNGGACIGNTIFTVSGHAGDVQAFEYQWDGTGGSWSDWTPTGATYTWNNDGNPAGTTLYVRARIGNSCGATPIYTNTVQVTPIKNSDAGAWGNGEWITHAYNQNDWIITASNHKGFYTEPSLSFNTTDRWVGNGTPFNDTDGTANAYKGCDIGNNNQTISSRRVDFGACQFYQVDGRHSQWGRLYVNGVLKHSDNATHTAVSTLWTGELGPTDSVEYVSRDGQADSYQQLTFTPLTLAAGTLTSSHEYLCSNAAGQNHGDYTATFSVAGHEGTIEQFEYQWDGTGGTWQTDWTHTGTSKTFVNNGSNTGSVLYVRARIGVTDGGGNCTPPADVYTNTVQVTPWNESTSGAPFGNGEWIAHAYNYSSIDLQHYAGFYTQTGLSYNANSRWTDANNSPYSAVANGGSLGYVGCNPGVDHHAVVYKRTNFGPCANYTISAAWDDRARLYVNGIKVYEELANDANTASNLWTGDLDENDSIEFRHREWTGGSQQALTFTVNPPPALVGGTLGSTAPANGGVCVGNTTFTVSGHVGTVEAFEYQWDGTTPGSWSEWTPTGATYVWNNNGANAGTTLYVRARIGSPTTCSVAADVYSNTVQVTPLKTTDAGAWGNGAWITHAYNENSFNLNTANHKGFYTETGLSFYSPDRWDVNLSPFSDNDVTANAYKGCNPGNDNHSVSSKRVGFGACQFYQVKGAHDDWAELYVNGVNKYAVNAIQGTLVNIWAGELGPTDSVMFVHREGAGGSWQQLQFTPLTLTAGTLTSSHGYLCSNAAGQNHNNYTATFSVAGHVGTVEQFEYQWDGTGGTWQTDWTNTSATTKTFVNNGSNTGSVLYVRARIGVTDGGGNCTPPADVYTNTVQVTPWNESTSGAPFGNGEWIAHAYNYSNINLQHYAGFYTQTGLSYNANSRWTDANNSPYSAVANGGSLGYVGCNPGNDDHTVVYKRTNFGPCANYTITATWDDRGRLYVNGVQMWENLSGPGGPTAIWTGDLDENDSIEFRHRDFSSGSQQALTFTVNTPPALVGGTLSSTAPANGGVCIGTTTFTVAGHVGTVEKFEYQWDGTGGTWLEWTPTTATTYNWTNSGANAGTTLYVRARIGSSTVCSVAPDVYSNTVQVTPIKTTDAGAWGNGEWITHAYNQNNWVITASNHKGFYTQPSLSFNTTDRWVGNGTPFNDTDGTANAYKGCDIGNNNQTISSRRVNFGACQFYQVDGRHSQWGRLYVNGVLEHSHDGNHGTVSTLWTGELGPTDSVEYVTRDGGGDSYQQLTFTPITLTAGTLGSNAPANGGVCVNSVTTFTVSGHTGGIVQDFEYQWDGTGGTWISGGTATPTTYTWTNDGNPAGSTLYVRAKVGNSCGGSPVYTNTVQVTPIKTTDAGAWGNGEWITHAYNENSFNLNTANHKGFYTETGLSFYSPDRWAGGLSPFHDNDVTANAYKGCDPGNDNHSISSKRVGFGACQLYQVKGAHDDYARLFINGVQEYAVDAVQGTLANLWTGELGPTDSVMFVHREGGGGSWQQLEFTPLTLTAGTLSSTTPANGHVCVGTTTFTVAGHVGTVEKFEYQWDGTGGTWLEWTPTTATTYNWTNNGANAGTTLYVRARVGLSPTGHCTPPADVYTNTVQVTPLKTTDAGAWGTNKWHLTLYDAYNLGAPNNPLGFYLEPKFSHNTQDRWHVDLAPSSDDTLTEPNGYKGCLLNPVTKQFTTHSKRTGFPCGNYT